MKNMWVVVVVYSVQVRHVSNDLTYACCPTYVGFAAAAVWDGWMMSPLIGAIHFDGEGVAGRGVRR